MFLIHLWFNHQNIAFQGLVISKKPFVSHFKTVLNTGSSVLPRANRYLSRGSGLGPGSRALDTEMCRSDSADYVGSVGNLCCVSVSTHENKKNPSREITQGEGNQWLL